MKFATYALLTGAVSAIETQEMTQVFNGLLKGSVDSKYQFDKKCFADLKEGAADIEGIVKDIKSPSIKNIEDAVKELKDIVAMVKAAVTDCKPGAQDDLKKLTDISTVLEKPSSVSWDMNKSLSINGADIMTEVNDAVKAYEAGQWEKLGEKLGEAAAKATQAEDRLTLAKRTKIAEVMQGITEAFGGHFDVLALLMCIQDEDKALLLFDAAVQTFVQAW